MLSPNIILIPGLPRCATTSLVNILAQSGDIEVGRNKEPHFFLPNKDVLYAYESNGTKSPISELGLNLTQSSYDDNFKVARKYQIDASTLYSAHEISPRLIHESNLFKSVKAILLCRGALERAYSHYCFSMSRGEEPLGFVEALNDELEGNRDDWILGGYMKGSRLNPFVDTYIQYYDKSTLKIIDISKTSIQDTLTVSKLCEFLDVPMFDFTNDVYQNTNIDIGSKKTIWFRAALRKIRQLNPKLLDNKLTRTVFYKVMRKMPKSKSNFQSISIPQELVALFDQIDNENYQLLKEYNL